MLLRIVIINVKKMMITIQYGYFVNEYTTIIALYVLI